MAKDKHMYLVEDQCKIGVYQHYKGNQYLLLDITEDNISQGLHVVYICLYNNEISPMWVRPKGIFMDQVGANVPRFKPLSPS